MDEPIAKILNNPLDINLRQCPQEDIDVALKKKSKIGKLNVLNKYPPKYGKQRHLTTYCSDTATPYTTRI